MLREQTSQAIIIKQSAFGEADEIITFFTREAGKIRALAKSVKLSTSKLRHGLQPMFSVAVTLTGGHSAGTKLSKIIGVTVAETFSNIAADSERVKRWYVVAELINKATPDEQNNEELFQLLLDFLTILNRPQISAAQLDLVLAKFKLELLAAIGLGIWHPAEANAQPRFFSNAKGGFFNTRLASDAVPVTSATWQSFKRLNSQPFSALHDEPAGRILPLGDLPQLVTDFLLYYLEREIKAEQFLAVSI